MLHFRISQYVSRWSAAAGAAHSRSLLLGLAHNTHINTRISQREKRRRHRFQNRFSHTKLWFVHAEH